LSRYHLLRSRPDVLKDLKKQISKGRDIGEGEYDEMDDALDDETKWDSYTDELLSRSFSDDQLVNEFKSISLPEYDDEAYDEEIADTHADRMRMKVTFLESIIERFPLIPDSGGEDSKTASTLGTRPNQSSPKVFIIHGHDEGAKSQLARFLQQLGLTAVILHEQPNQGRTIIEKLERHSDDVAFAIALLTPDDVGGSALKSMLKPRARENVIYELGLFQSRLGRDRVCILHKGVDVPTDISGVVYHEMDKAGGWQVSLAKELKAAGMPVDLNLIT